MRQKLWLVALGICCTSIVHAVNMGNSTHLLPALREYQRGNFRQVTLFITNKGLEDPLSLYLLARSYEDRMEFKSAVRTYDSISIDDLKKTSVSDDLRDNYVYRYSETMRKARLSGRERIRRLDTLLPLLPENSPHSTSIYENYAYLLWYNGRRSDVANIQVDSPTLRIYKDLLAYEVGDRRRLRSLLRSFDSFKHKRAYNSFLSSLTPKDLNTRELQTLALNASLTLHMWDAADTALSQIKQSNDEDFATRSEARIFWAKRQRNQAVRTLQSFVKANSASLLTVSLLIRYQNARGWYRSSYELLKKELPRFGSPLYRWYIRVLDELSLDQELFEFYKAHAKDMNFRAKYARSILRNLISRNLKLANQAMDITPDHETDPWLLYTRGLIAYENEEWQKAYELFLPVTLNHPFTYEWVVAKRYEAKLRPRFRSLYNEALKAFIQRIEHADSKYHVYWALGLKEIDTGAFQTNIHKGDLRELRRSLAKGFETAVQPRNGKLNLSPMLQNNGRLWNLETYSQMMEAIEAASEGSFSDRARYIYANHNLFKSMDMEGVTVHAMYTYTYNYYQGFQFNVLLPRETLQAIYPLLEYDHIETILAGRNLLSPNRPYSARKQAALSDDHTLWVLSSFRAESLFRKWVRSYVGAVGYAQVMPATARFLERKLKRPELDVYDFADNIFLGVTLYRYLLDRYDNNYAYALAAYNAGEGAVNRWRRRYPHTTELWIESIKYRETRNYVKSIIRTRYLYSWIYDLQPLGYPVYP